MAKNRKAETKPVVVQTSELVANCDHLLSIKYSPTLPYVFTEQGVSMLSSVLHSDTAVDVSIQIMDAFVAMRHFLVSNAAIFWQQHSDVVLNERQRTILNLYLDGYEGKLIIKNMLDFPRSHPTPPCATSVILFRESCCAPMKERNAMSSLK